MKITETEIKRQVRVALLFNPDKYVSNENEVDALLMFKDVVKKMNIKVSLNWKKPVEVFLHKHISSQVKSMGFKYIIKPKNPDQWRTDTLTMD
jgi:hypothetical protein